MNYWAPKSAADASALSLIDVSLPSSINQTIILHGQGAEPGFEDSFDVMSFVRVVFLLLLEKIINCAYINFNTSSWPCYLITNPFK